MCVSGVSYNLVQGPLSKYQCFLSLSSATTFKFCGRVSKIRTGQNTGVGGPCNRLDPSPQNFRPHVYSRKDYKGAMLTELLEHQTNVLHYKFKSYHSQLHVSFLLCLFNKQHPLTKFLALYPCWKLSSKYLVVLTFPVTVGIPVI